jgi:uncharacterized membrane protein YdjX (TVP38/TMEM64 family)
MLHSLRETVARFGVVGSVALFTGLGPLLGAFALAATAPLWLDPFLDAGALRFPVFLVLTAVLAAWCLIPTHASSLVGGMAFGFGLGTLMALVGTALAAALGFVTLRFLLRDRALEALSHHPRAEAVHREFDEGHAMRTIALLALIRLSPVMPFAGTNLLMSTTGIGMLPFLVGSIVGQAPRIIAVVWIGASLTELDLSQASDQRLLVVGVAATIVVLWVLGRASRRGLSRLEGE